MSELSEKLRTAAGGQSIDDVRDWRRAVDHAMEHVRSLDRAPLRLVPNDLMGEM